MNTDHHAGCMISEIGRCTCETRRSGTKTTRPLFEEFACPHCSLGHRGQDCPDRPARKPPQLSLF